MNMNELHVDICHERSFMGPPNMIVWLNEHIGIARTILMGETTGVVFVIR